MHLLIWKPGLVKKIPIHQSTVVNHFPSSQLVQLILDFIISVVMTFDSCWGTRNTQTTAASCFKLHLLRIKTTVFRWKTRITQQKSCDAYGLVNGDDHFCTYYGASSRIICPDCEYNIPLPHPSAVGCARFNKD